MPESIRVSYQIKAAVVAAISALLYSRQLVAIILYCCNRRKSVYLELYKYIDLGKERLGGVKFCYVSKRVTRGLA